MANQVSRGIRMDKSLIIRCTEQDKSELRMEANKRGMTVCSMVRQLLIAEKILSPSNVAPDIDL